MALAGWPGWDDEKLRPWLARIPPGELVHGRALRQATRSWRLRWACTIISDAHPFGLASWAGSPAIWHTPARGLGRCRQCRGHGAADRRGVTAPSISTQSSWRLAALKSYLKLGYVPFLYAPEMARTLAERSVAQPGLAIHAGSVAVIRVRKRTGSLNVISRESGNPGTTAGHPPSRV